MPKVGQHDLFEMTYRAELWRRLAPYGIPIELARSIRDLSRGTMYPMYPMYPMDFDDAIAFHALEVIEDAEPATAAFYSY